MALDDTTIVVLVILVILALAAIGIAIGCVCRHSREKPEEPPLSELPVGLAKDPNRIYIRNPKKRGAYEFIDLAELKRKWAHPAIVEESSPRVPSTMTNDVLAKLVEEDVQRRLRGGYLVARDPLKPGLLLHVDVERLVNNIAIIESTADAPLEIVSDTGAAVTIPMEDEEAAVCRTEALVATGFHRSRQLDAAAPGDLSASPSSLRASSSHRRMPAYTASNSVVSGPPADVEVTNPYDRRGARLPLVAPRIYPCNNRDISIHTNVEVSANRYVDLTTSRLASLPARAERLLDELWFKTVASGDAERKKRTRSTAALGITVRLATMKRDGESFPALAQLPEGLLALRVVGQQDLSAMHRSDITAIDREPLDLCVVALPGVCRVCWMGDTQWHWYDPSHPVRLRAGHWCIRAEAVNRPGEFDCEPVASSRVFVVTDCDYGLEPTEF